MAVAWVPLPIGVLPPWVRSVDIYARATTGGGAEQVDFRTGGVTAPGWSGSSVAFPGEAAGKLEAEFTAVVPVEYKNNALSLSVYLVGHER